MGLRLALMLRLLLGIFAVSCGSPVWADPTLFMSDPKLSANVLLNLASNAEKEVLLASYVFKPDRAGLMKLVALRKVAREGKRAALLLDAQGNGVPKELLSYLASEGVEIYLFHPFSLKNPLRYLRRSHLKISVVDGVHLVDGDRNSGKEYFGLDAKSSISRDFYAGGKAAQDAKSFFEKLIKSNEVVRFKGLALSPSKVVSQRKFLDDMENSSLMRRLTKDVSWKDKVFESDAVESFHDPVGKKGIVPGVEQTVLEAIEKAQKRITFENPYVVLTDSFKSALQRAAERGVKIRVLTNSIDSTNKKLVAAAWEQSRDFLASIGAEVWELPGNPTVKKARGKEVDAKGQFRKLRALLKEDPDARASFGFLHAKTMLIDDTDSYIMSYNFDARSENLNMESVNHIKGKEFNQLLSAEIEKDIVQAGYQRVAAEGKLLLPENAKRSSCLMKGLARLLESQL